MGRLVSCHEIVSSRRKVLRVLPPASEVHLPGGGPAGGWRILRECAFGERGAQADTVIHEIYTRLNSTFITPLDPEDIHSLSSHLDDVIDGIEDAVHRMLHYKIDPMPGTVVELCKLVQSCSNVLAKAVEEMTKGGDFLDHCIEINRLETAADQLGREAVARLFEEEKDPIRIIKLKEIYEFLELTTDCCEDVADALQNIHVKHS
jgi:uncharacterized protein